jgi:hypothetical protein
VKRKFFGGFLVLTAALSTALLAEQMDPALYVGVKRCRMCHSKPEYGNQFAQWQGTTHAKAIATLGTAEAKAAGAKAGVTDPQQSGKCLKCHATAYNLTEKVQTEALPVEEGVSCESCHGPGKQHKGKPVMNEQKQFTANALLIYPAMKSCTSCHNEQSPTWKPDRYTTKEGKKVGFDPDQAYEAVKHPNPKRHP